jgi:hypothetical protein
MKAFYESKTFWFNMLVGIIALAGLFGFSSFEPSQDVIEIIGVVVSGVNLILRFLTKQPIGWK